MVDAVARQQLAAPDMTLARTLAAAQHDLGDPRLEIVDQTLGSPDIVEEPGGTGIE